MFSDEELANIADLRQSLLGAIALPADPALRTSLEAAVKQAHGYLNPTAESVLFEHMLDTSTLWRFYTAHIALASHEAIVKSAVAMFVHANQWRIDVKMPELMRDWRGGPRNSPITEQALLGQCGFYAKLLDHAGGLASVRGGPIMVERLGRIDLAGLYYDELMLEAVLKSYMVYMESAWREVRQRGGKTRAIIIIDTEGLHAGFLWFGFSLVQWLAETDDWNRRACLSGDYRESFLGEDTVGLPIDLGLGATALAGIYVGNIIDKSRSCEVSVADVFDILSSHPFYSVSYTCDNIKSIRVQERTQAKVHLLASDHAQVKYMFFRVNL